MEQFKNISCKSCGKLEKVYEGEEHLKIIDGLCLECLFKKTKIGEFLRINHFGVAFKLINDVILDMKVPREKVYDYIRVNRMIQLYLEFEDDPCCPGIMIPKGRSLTPLEKFQYLVLGRTKDFGRLWTEEEEKELDRKLSDKK